MPYAICHMHPFADLLSFLEMLAACLYLPCLLQTCLRFPRPVFASLDLSQLPYRCPSLAMSSGWSSPEFLLSPEFLCCLQSPSVVARVPQLSLEFVVLRVRCPQSSLSSEFVVLRVRCPQSSLSSEFFRDPL